MRTSMFSGVESERDATPQRAPECLVDIVRSTDTGRARTEQARDGSEAEVSVGSTEACGLGRGSLTDISTITANHHHQPFNKTGARLRIRRINFSRPFFLSVSPPIHLSPSPLHTYYYFHLDLVK